MGKRISLQSAFNQLNQYVRIASSSMLKLRDNLQLNWNDHKHIKELIAQLSKPAGNQVPEMSDDDFKAAVNRVGSDLLNRMILVTDSNESKKKFIRKAAISPTYSMIISESNGQPVDACFMYDRDRINVLMTPTTELGVWLEVADNKGVDTVISAISKNARIVRPLLNATVLDNQTGECMLKDKLDVVGTQVYMSSGGRANPNPIEVCVDSSIILAYDGTPSPFTPLYGRDKVYIHDRSYTDSYDDSGKRGCLVVPVEAKQFVPVRFDIPDGNNSTGSTTTYCFMIYNDSDVRQCYCLTPTLQQANTTWYSMIVFKTDVIINEAKKETNLLCFQQLAGKHSAFNSSLDTVSIPGYSDRYWLRALLGALPIKSELMKFNFRSRTVVQV